MGLEHAGRDGPIPDPALGMRTFSRRRLVPDTREALLHRPMPRTNMPPATPPEPPPPDPPACPYSFTRLDQIIPEVTLRAARRWLTRVRKALRLALHGDIEGAVACAPRPWVPPPEGMWTPEAKGYGAFDIRPILAQEGPARQLIPSRWPDRPPATGLNLRVVASERHMFPDGAIMSRMLHGFPDNALMPLVSCFCAPHGSALRHIAVMAKALHKDASSGWVEWSPFFVPTWPYVGDACGVVWRGGKPRLCWDKSGARRVPNFIPFNRALPMDELPIIVYLSVGDVCLMIAIMLVPVHANRDARDAGSTHVVLQLLVGLFDLRSAYRVIGRQRADLWKQGVIWVDAASLDGRLQFGDASACNTFNRTTNYGVWRARRRLAYIDSTYPPRVVELKEWQLQRRASGLGAELSFVMGYFDDMPFGAFDDALVDERGVACMLDGAPVRRCDAVARECMTAFEEIGHVIEPEKTQWPSLHLTCQGALIDVHAEQLQLHPDKRVAYLEALHDILRAAPRVPRSEYNSVAHKLLYCATIMIRLRILLFHIFRCLHGSRFSSVVHLTTHAINSLRSCALALEHSSDHTLPLAWREHVPSIGDGAIAQYADAAGDGLGTPGFGVWWVVGRRLFLVFGAWHAHQLSLPIHVLEFWTNSMGLEAVWTQDHKHEFIVEFTDNVAAEVIGDSQYSSSEPMMLIAEWRSDFMDATGVCSLPQRVSSAHNVWADMLSRGLASEVLRQALLLGLSPTVLPVPPRSAALLEALVHTHNSTVDT